jgi:hypothetical protein
VPYSLTLVTNAGPSREAGGLTVKELPPPPRGWRAQDWNSIEATITPEVRVRGKASGRGNHNILSAALGKVLVAMWSVVVADGRRARRGVCRHTPTLATPPGPI